MLRFLFIFYCAEAGALLLYLPWTPLWDRELLWLPHDQLRIWALGPWLRGVVSGFGLLHLLWGAHDLDAWILERRRRRAAP